MRIDGFKERRKIKFSDRLSEFPEPPPFEDTTAWTSHTVCVVNCCQLVHCIVSGTTSAGLLSIIASRFLLGDLSQLLSDTSAFQVAVVAGSLYQLTLSWNSLCSSVIGQESIPKILVNLPVPTNQSVLVAMRRHLDRNTCSSWTWLRAADLQIGQALSSVMARRNCRKAARRLW